MLTKIKNLIIKLTILVFSLGLTFFILASTYEVTANTDLPYVQSITPISAQDAVNKIVKYNQEAGLKDFGNKRYVSLGALDYLYFPAQHVRIFTGKDRKIPETNEGKWYMKPNNAHYIILNKDKNGVEGDYLFYTNQSWRTIPNADLINIGDKVQLSNIRGDLYQFIVSDRQLLTNSDSYISTQTNDRQLILIVDYPEQNAYFAFAIRPENT
ncbi:MAG: hypothetical protein H7196_01690 [candidate division SR1 bacterium]|nr:hypothetical protein [candidate division SR1 bacterium]